MPLFGPELHGTDLLMPTDADVQHALKLGMDKMAERCARAEQRLAAAEETIIRLQNEIVLLRQRRSVPYADHTMPGLGE